MIRWDFRKVFFFLLFGLLGILSTNHLRKAREPALEDDDAHPAQSHTEGGVFFLWHSSRILPRSMIRCSLSYRTLVCYLCAELPDKICVCLSWAGSKICESLRHCCALCWRRKKCDGKLSTKRYIGKNNTAPWILKTCGPFGMVSRTVVWRWYM